MDFVPGESVVNMRDKESSMDLKANEDSYHNNSNHFGHSYDVQVKKAKRDKSTRKYTPTQLITLVTLAFGNFCIGACNSLQAPFFPREAEAKGATPTEYGFIFGAYQLTIFIVAPVMGKLIAYVEPKFILNSGILTVSVTCILFGVLDLSPDGLPFVTLAFVVRIVEGIGAAALRTAAYTIIAAQFKDKTSTTFAFLETFLGLGLITGPTLGGALYDLGGYGLPFFVMGSLSMLDALIIFIILPNPEKSENEEKAEVLKFWLNPGIITYSLTIITTFNYIGYNQATLEPHIRVFNLSGVLLGMMFALTGAVYAISATFWGWLSDKEVGNRLLIFVGCCLMIVSFFLLGPMPFFNFEQSIGLVIVALLFMGLGIGAKLVCAFGGSVEDTIARGFPKDLTTYGLISSMFASSQSLGAFVGPSLGGYLLDEIGFRMATVVLLCLEILLMITLSIYGSSKRCRDSPIADEEKNPIIEKNSQQQSYS